MVVQPIDGGPTIYTVGHSNLSVADFVTVLKGNGIRLLVDVRSMPYSQFSPHYNRENLDRTLKVEGIDYRFAGESLGGRPTDPTCYKDRVVPEGHANYLELVDYEEVARRAWFHAGIERLLELARECPTAMMCSEEDPARCHRYHLITQAIVDVARVVDIRTRPNGRYTLSEATRKPRQMLLI